MINLKYLHGLDIFSYAELNFEFTTGIASISAGNGSGKSSVYHSLSLCLFNRCAKDIKIDDANNNVTGRPFEITVELEKNGDTYKIVNSRKTGDIKIWKNSKPIHVKGIKENLKLIQEEILGCTYETFTMLTFQSSSSELGLVEDDTDTARKGFLSKVLRFQELDNLLDKFKKKEGEISGKNGRLPTLESQLRTFESSLSEPQEELEENPEEENILQIQVELLEREVGIKKSELAVQNSELVKLNQQYDAYVASESVTKRIAEIETELSSIVLPLESKEELKVAESNLSENLVASQGNVDRFNTKIKEYALLAKQSVCPVLQVECKYEHLKKDLEAKIIEAKEQLTVNEENYKKILGMLQGIAAKIQVYKQKETLEAELNKLRANNQSVNLDFNLLCNQKTELEEKLKLQAACVCVLADKLTPKREQLTSIREHNQNARAVKNLNKKIEESNGKLRVQIEVTKKEIAELEKKLTLVKDWVKILGKDGMRVTELKRFLANLNKIIFKYSKILSEGQILSWFTVDEAGKIEFWVKDSDKQLPYANYSEGEKARIRLCALFSILELLEVTTESCFNLLFLDEVYGPLDLEGRESLFKALAYLKQKGKCVYSISHTEVVNPVLFDSNIKIVKENGIARIV